MTSEHSGADQDWELLSASSDGGGSSEALEQLREEAALAASFLLAEPQVGAGAETSGGEESDSDQVGLPMPTVSPAPGSPLKLLAGPPSPSRWLAATELPPLAARTASGHSTSTAGETSSGQGIFRASSPTQGGSSSSNLPLPRTGSICLRVVRSDEQEALQRALDHRDQELALARSRLASAQVALQQEAREAHKFRKLAVIACSVCAFLGLKALLGRPYTSTPTASSPASSAAAVTAGAAAARPPVMAHSPQEPGPTGPAMLAFPALEQGPMQHCAAETAVEVEPLTSCI